MDLIRFGGHRPRDGYDVHTDDGDSQAPAPPAVHGLIRAAGGRFVPDKGKSADAESPTGTGVVAAPVTYEIDRRQYVSVAVGWGGAFGLSLARRSARRPAPSTRLPLAEKPGVDKGGNTPNLGYVPADTLSHLDTFVFSGALAAKGMLAYRPQAAECSNAGTPLEHTSPAA